MVWWMSMQSEKHEHFGYAFLMLSFFGETEKNIKKKNK